MINLSTFEDIFNKLIDLYQGKEVELISKQDNIIISNFTLTISKITIKPLSKRQSKKWTRDGKKVGLIIIQDKNTKTYFNIPFILGFNTMKATFLKNGARIKSLKMEFLIKEVKKKSKNLRKAN
ncbi:MAG: hypothetical protein ACOCRO_06110 [Halanaerobiales bacterium]